MIPTGVEALHETDASPPSHQAVVHERSLPSDIRAVALQHRLRLGGVIGMARWNGTTLAGELCNR